MSIQRSRDETYREDVGEDMTWELVDNYTLRMKVPTGWIVKVIEDISHDQYSLGRGMQNGLDYRVALCFVPDSSHDWKLEKI